MLNISVLAVGSLGERHWADACREYAKRLSAFCKLELVEIGEARLARDPSAAEIEKALRQEAEAILARLGKRTYVIPLCVEGQGCDSPALAKKLETVASEFSSVTFVIGSSFGLAGELKARADWKLSLSAMTFPHQLCRVMLLEQLYRAFAISGGLRYHK